MIATFAVPSEAVLTEIREGSFMAGLKAYLQSEDAVTTLGDGTVVRMARSCALRYLMAIRKGFPVLPMACTEEDGKVNYEPIEREAEREAVEALKQERFRAFCAEDGHNGTEITTEHCPHCGEAHAGVTYYSPDAMGYPTPTLWVCSTCQQSS